MTAKRRRRRGPATGRHEAGEPPAGASPAGRRGRRSGSSGMAGCRPMERRPMGRRARGRRPNGSRRGREGRPASDPRQTGRSACGSCTIITLPAAGLQIQCGITPRANSCRPPLSQPESPAGTSVCSGWDTRGARSGRMPTGASRCLTGDFGKWTIRSIHLSRLERETHVANDPPGVPLVPVCGVVTLRVTVPRIAVPCGSRAAGRVLTPRCACIARTRR